MSASTVALTANPAVVTNTSSLALGSRRRTVSVTEKRSSNIEMVGEGGGMSEQGGVDGRELSHSIRGDSALEKSKDILVINSKKGVVVGSAVSPRRGRKLVSRTPEKPMWQTILSVVTKNSLLVLFVLGLFQMFYNSYLKQGMGNGTAVSTMGMSEIEERIAEVEASLKTTTKMMQVQVEVVDRKIESEVGGLRRELTKKLDEKDVLLKNELKKLVVKTEGLDTSISELKSSGFLKKEDFEIFLSELKNSRSDREREKDWSLDEIRSVAREIVEKEIEKHAADGLGRVDYALGSAGANVVRHSEPYFDNRWGFLKKNTVHSDANKMLLPSLGEPGQCFALKSRNGFVEIKLRTAIIPEAITLEHITKSVSYDRSSAPKDCRVFGWFQSRVSDPIVVPRFLLTEFSYDLERSNAQTFTVDSTDLGVVNMVRLDFSSNHGASHTCIYRFRVHGQEQEPNSRPLLSLES
ncbi:hypothetical protein GIB67_037804 [Kingdonia uniflora]|uniref:SUN domain-containing protein n=1 Tax=Kingdonia uniflora TaxID=39325 RepID=A0A7J7LVA5_9MAGN|nr:hypothetical protein GIB67_037804 [Kingdonia uniflora]